MNAPGSQPPRTLFVRLQRASEHPRDLGPADDQRETLCITLGLQFGERVNHRIVLFGPALLAALFVAAYAYLLLPLDLGLGLADAYDRLQPLTFGDVTTCLWMVIIGLVAWGVSRRATRMPSWPRTAALSSIATAIAFLTSYPLVVLYMYVSLDFVMPSGQLSISLTAGRLYYLALALSAVAIVGTPILMFAMARRRDVDDFQPAEETPAARAK